MKTTKKDKIIQIIKGDDECGFYGLSESGKLYMFTSAQWGLLADSPEEFEKRDL